MPYMDFEENAENDDLHQNTFVTGVRNFGGTCCGPASGRVLSVWYCFCILFVSSSLLMKVAYAKIR
jgi:hypothetical protein